VSRTLSAHHSRKEPSPGCFRWPIYFCFLLSERSTGLCERAKMRTAAQSSLQSRTSWKAPFDRHQSKTRLQATGLACFSNRLLRGGYGRRGQKVKRSARYSTRGLSKRTSRRICFVTFPQLPAFGNDSACATCSATVRFLVNTTEYQCHLQLPSLAFSLLPPSSPLA